MATVDRDNRHTALRMSDLSVASGDLGQPDSTGDNWQIGVRPAESLDAARVEIVKGPDDSPPGQVGQTTED